MTDIELLERLLICIDLRKPQIKPSKVEADTDKYLRWAVEQVAHRIWWDNRDPK